MNTSFRTKRRNDGYSVKRLRDILGMKQEELAEILHISLQTFLNIEQREVLDDDILNTIANALNVSVDTIKNFNEEAPVNIISNTFTSNDTSVLNAVNYQCPFNTLDKVIELYERMLKAEQEKVNILEQMLKDK